MGNAAVDGAGRRARKGRKCVSVKEERSRETGTSMGGGNKPEPKTLSN